MASGITMTKDNVDRLLRSMETIPQRDVLVGIPDSDSDRSSPGAGSAMRRESGGKAQDITNPALGFVHEYGSPLHNVPARPHLMPGIRAAKPMVIHYLGQGAKALLADNAAGADRALHAAGMVAMVSVQKMIQAGLQPPLKQATVTARRRRSTTSRYRRKAVSPDQVKPLIDTSQYLRAFTYVVRSPGAGETL